MHYFIILIWSSLSSLQPNSEVHVHWKGAAEIVLDSCTKCFDINDQLVKMDEDKVCRSFFFPLLYLSNYFLCCGYMASLLCCTLNIGAERHLMIWYTTPLDWLDFPWHFSCLQVSFFKKAIEDMASRSLRCVAIAYRPYDGIVPTEEEELSQWILPEDDLILLAIVGIKV